MTIAMIRESGHVRLSAAGCLALMLLLPMVSHAASLLGSARPFAVLGAAMVSNTGPTSINGDLGEYPGGSATGLGTVTLNGAVHLGDAVAQSAQGDATTAFNVLEGLPTGMDLTGRDLGSVGVLAPGVYTFSSAAQLTGTLTLDFGVHPDTPFVFQVGGALTTAAAADVEVLDGGPGSAIYWEIGSSATLGTGTMFAGNILAGQSITLDTGAAIICGRAIALIGAVTLDTNVVSANCAGGGDYGTGRTDFGSLGFSGGPGGGGVPEAPVWAQMLLGLGGAGLALRSRKSRPAAG